MHHFWSWLTREHDLLIVRPQSSEGEEGENTEEDRELSLGWERKTETSFHLGISAPEPGL